MIALQLALAFVVAVVASVTDLRTRRIPDWLTLSAASAGLGVHIADARTALATTLLTSALGALACAVLPFVFSRSGKIGLGDVKLFLAIGAILGPSLGFETEVYAFAVAFPVTLVLKLKKTKIEWLPFAPAICAGVLVEAITHR